MVRRHFMFLAAFLMKPQPAPGSLVIEVSLFERQHRADAGKTKERGWLNSNKGTKCDVASSPNPFCTLRFVSLD
jgi:hypothetical protein